MSMEQYTQDSEVSAAIIALRVQLAHFTPFLEAATGLLGGALDAADAAPVGNADETPEYSAHLAANPPYRKDLTNVIADVMTLADSLYNAADALTRREGKRG